MLGLKRGPQACDPHRGEARDLSGDRPQPRQEPGGLTAQDWEPLQVLPPKDPDLRAQLLKATYFVPLYSLLSHREGEESRGQGAQGRDVGRGVALGDQTIWVCPQPLPTQSPQSRGTFPPYKMISNQRPGLCHSEGVCTLVRDITHPTPVRPPKGLYPGSAERHVYWVYCLPLLDCCRHPPSCLSSFSCTSGVNQSPTSEEPQGQPGPERWVGPHLS